MKSLLFCSALLIFAAGCSQAPTEQTAATPQFPNHPDFKPAPEQGPMPESVLVRFKGTGKPSWAHIEEGGNLEYYLATGCSKIAASPTAMLDVSGLAAEVTFYRGSLDKLGIQAQFEGVGKYKNAPNQLTEKGFTEPHREQMEALVGQIFEAYVDGIAQGRNLEPAEVRALEPRSA